MHLKDQFMQNDFCVVARAEISLPRKLKRANVWHGRNSRGGERGGQMELPPSLPTGADFGYLHHNRCRKGVAVGP